MRRAAIDTRTKTIAAAPMLIPAIAPLDRLLVGSGDVVATSCVADVAEGTAVVKLDTAEVEVAVLKDEAVVVYKSKSCG